jgi:hypothetical protein
MLPALLLALACAAPAADDGCSKCDHLGVLPCHRHDDVPAAEEELVPFCSFAARCEACGGALWVDCPKCAGGLRSAEVEQRRAEIAHWMKENSLEQHMGRALPRLESARFALVVDVEALPEGRKKLSGHVLAHRMIEDEEHVAARVAEHYQLQPIDYRAKMRMWLWRSLEAHQKCQARFLGTLTTGDFKVLGRDPVFSVWTEPTNFDDATKVRTVFAHNAAHMLLSNAIAPEWVGDCGGGWLDAGLGHWYEYDRFGFTMNYCIEEATLPENWEDGRWRAPIRRWLEGEREPFLPALFQKNTGAMRQSEQALCWSFHDFLVAEHPRSLRPILSELKKRQRPAREILKEALGLDLFQAEEAWRAWVSATYPLKGDEPRTEAGGGKKSAK